MTDFLHISSRSPTEKHEGHCIRCSAVISYNPHKPFCLACYSLWEEQGNVDLEEDYCHCCGNMLYTSKSQPECYPCYSENNLSGPAVARTG